MDKWIKIFVKDVANELTSRPRIPVSEAVERVQQVLQNEGFLSREQINVLTDHFHALRDPFGFRGILNPVFLKRELGIQTFIYLFNTREGQYSDFRRFIKEWGEDADHSRYILFGEADLLVIMHATEEIVSRWRDYVAERRWVYDTLEVRDISFIKGHKVVKSGVARLPDDIAQEQINTLVSNYWTTELESARSQLEKLRILLGPSAVEDLSMTGRLKAFLAFKIHGRFPQSEEAFTKFLLEELGAYVQSIYHCIGQYQLLVEVICNGNTELDHITDLVQDPPSADYRIQSVTHVVATVDVEASPHVVTLQVPPWGKGFDEFVREVAEQEIVPLGSDITNKFFNELPRERVIFLTNALYEINRSRQSLALSNGWGDLLGDAVQQFTRGYVAESPSDIAAGVVTLGKSVESVSTASLRATLNVFYEGNFAQAQRDLSLPDRRPERFTLQKYVNVFTSINKQNNYEALGIHFTGDLFEHYSVFISRRNDLAHDPLPERYRNDFSLFAREVREAFLHGLEIIDWHTKFMERLERSLSDELVPPLMRLLQRSWEAPTPAPIDLENLHFELQKNMDRLRHDLETQLSQAEEQRREYYNQLLFTLGKLTAVETARKKEEQFWRERFKLILDNQEEFLTYLQPLHQNRLRSWLEATRDIGQDLTINLVANLIWYLIIQTPSDLFVRLLEKLF